MKPDKPKYHNLTKNITKKKNYRPVSLMNDLLANQIQQSIKDIPSRVSSTATLNVNTSCSRGFILEMQDIQH